MFCSSFISCGSQLGSASGAEENGKEGKTKCQSSREHSVKMGQMGGAISGSSAEESGREHSDEWSTQGEGGEEFKVTAIFLSLPKSKELQMKLSEKLERAAC